MEKNIQAYKETFKKIITKAQFDKLIKQQLELLVFGKNRSRFHFESSQNCKRKWFGDEFQEHFGNWMQSVNEYSKAYWRRAR